MGATHLALSQCGRQGEEGLSIGEGNGTLLQYCCLENPMDGGAW